MQAFVCVEYVCGYVCALCVWVSVHVYVYLY